MSRCLVWQPRCLAVNINKNTEICELLEICLSAEKNSSNAKILKIGGWDYYGITVEQKRAKITGGGGLGKLMPILAADCLFYKQEGKNCDAS